MKLKQLQACILMLVISGIVFFSCRKTTISDPPEGQSSKSRDELIQKAKNEIFSKPQTVFSSHMKITEGMIKTTKGSGPVVTGKGQCNYTFSGDLYYSIVSLPCSGGINEYRIDFTYYLYTNGNYSGPLLSGVTVAFNNVALSNPTDYTYTAGVPGSSMGYTFTGSSLFSTVGISCNATGVNLDFSGYCFSYLCSPGDNFSLSVPIHLRPSACSGISPTAEIYPADDPTNNNGFWVFFPWDLICFDPCYLPNDWNDIELEYYKDPTGSLHTVYTGMSPFDFGPYAVSIGAEGTGTYYVRGRFLCAGGGTGAWSGWHAVPVN